MLSLFKKSEAQTRAIRRKMRARRRLRTECLEGRRLLAGVVNVDTTAAGDLSLVGDVSNNSIAVHGTAVPGQFVIEGQSGTLLTLDGGLQTFSTLTVNGITDDLIAALGEGQDRFELGNASDPTDIGNDVTITNSDDDTNVLTNVDIGGALSVTRADTAYSDLSLTGSIVRSGVTIDNNDGDTKTTITSSEIEGLLDIDNGAGDDVIVVDGTSIGAALFTRPGLPGNPSNPVVDIVNGNGSSLTSFTQKNDPDATGFLPSGTLDRPTIFGGINISNGEPIPAGLVVPPPVVGGSTPSQLAVAVDIVVFNQADVLGHVDIDNTDGHTETVIVNSNLGTDTKEYDAGDLPNSGYGGPVTIDNGIGFDVLEFNDSTAQYGMSVNNGTGTHGSATEIRNSEFGGRGAAGLGLTFMGDDGDTVFNISDDTTGTMIDGLLSITLGDGHDSVQLSGIAGGSQIMMDSLTIVGDEGDDGVLIQNTEIDSMVMISLADGADTIEIRDGIDFPSGLLGTIDIDGGIGADFFFVSDTTIPLTDFQIPIS